MRTQERAEGHTDADRHGRILTYVVSDNGKMWREVGGGMGCTVLLYDAMVLFVVYSSSIVRRYIAVLANTGTKHWNADGVTRSRAVDDKPCAHSH